MFFNPWTHNSHVCECVHHTCTYTYLWMYCTMHQSSPLVNQHTKHWICPAVCLTCDPPTPSCILYLLQCRQSGGRRVRLGWRRRGGSWWDQASGRWRRVCERKDRKRGGETDRETLEFQTGLKTKQISPSSTTLLLLRPAFALLSNPPLVAPTFLKKTLDAEQKAQYLGGGGRLELGRGLRLDGF